MGQTSMELYDTQSFQLSARPQSTESRPHRLWVAEMLSKKTGLLFGVADLGSGDILPGPVHDLCLSVDSPICEVLSPVVEPRLYTGRDGLIYMAVPIPGDVQSETVCLAVAMQPHAACLESVRDRVLGAGWSLHEWDEWHSVHSNLSEDLLERLLILATESIRSEVSLKRTAAEADSLAEQVNLLYEQMNLIQGLTQQLRVSLDPVELATAAISEVMQTLDAKGCGVFISEESGEPVWVTAGQIPIEPSWLQSLLAEQEDHPWPKPLVLNRRGNRTLCEFDPAVNNLLVCPISNCAKTVGWVVCLNARMGVEFGSVEARLVSSVTAVLATHLQNVQLFRENDALVVSLIRSLVRTIDAKDAYTRGHSIRVALVSRRLAAELGLNEHEQETVYLSGLMHDVGKIGVDDSILRKPGALTDEEFRAIQQHPTIGYEILSNVPSLKPILGGVLHHHESYDGTGYPAGLKGEQIPRIARIMAVADAFDAMGSSRPYRRGMDFDTVFDKLRKGAGTQWDAAVVAALERIRPEVERAWSAAEGHNARTEN